MLQTPLLPPSLPRGQQRRVHWVSH